MSSMVLIEEKDHIATIKLNRPDKLNALSNDLVEDLKESINQYDKRDDIKAIILIGEGKAFCAGGDIETMNQFENPYESVKWVNKVSDLAKQIVDAQTYIISAVHGYAAGAGFSLALASDFIIAHYDAKFAISFTNIGLIPDLGMIPLLKQRMSPPILKEWISTGKVLSTDELKDYQLINCISSDDLLNEVIQFSQFIVNGPPIANEYVKYLINQTDDLSIAHALKIENQIQAMLLQTKDHQEGVQAFLEKRTPLFKGI